MNKLFLNIIIIVKSKVQLITCFFLIINLDRRVPLGLSLKIFLFFGVILIFYYSNFSNLSSYNYFYFFTNSLHYSSIYLDF